MQSFADIVVLRREYGGFALGAITMIVCYEWAGRWNDWFALVCCAVMFFGFPIIRRYLK